MTSMEDVLRRLSGIEGVVSAFPLEYDILEAIGEAEDQINSAMSLNVENAGLEECLKKENIVCIIKDHRFRPPPEPTVLLIGDDDRIIGKEIVPSDECDYRDDTDVILLSEDFVVFRNQHPSIKERFVMPPVRFPELEELDGISDVASCSPSVLGDQLLRQEYGLNDDSELASILIGFDWRRKSA